MDFGMPFLLETPTIEACCRTARSLGLQFVELNASFPQCRPDALSISSLKKLMRVYGVYFTLHMDETFDPFSPNPAIRSMWLKQLRRCLHIAVRLHMPTVNMHIAPGVYITLPTGRVYLHERYPDQYRDALLQLSVTVQSCLYGSATHLCIENTDGWRAHEQQAISQLLTGAHFGLTMDIGHMHVVNGLDEPLYTDHQDRLWHMHVHDALGAHPHLALGDGEIDLAARLRLAEQCGARVVLETKSVEALRQSTHWLQTNMPQMWNQHSSADP